MKLIFVLFISIIAAFFTVSVALSSEYFQEKGKSYLPWAEDVDKTSLNTFEKSCSCTPSEIRLNGKDGTSCVCDFEEEGTVHALVYPQLILRGHDIEIVPNVISLEECIWLCAKDSRCKSARVNMWAGTWQCYMKNVNHEDVPDKFERVNMGLYFYLVGR
ncbi:uncharacterized protein LOC143228289 [Tachypleus tridentatus]|uniref:uncharacterized protein LOC143228289 n=1 Tax=Tachypleus tridentatus TaxID=6853 RepID=UPI003FD0AC91